MFILPRVEFYITNLGYMCHEHPTPRANQEFAEYLKKTIIEWYNEQK